MQLVVGLGNPGPRYAATRHNIGFRCLEMLARRLRLDFTAAGPKFRAAVGDGPAGPVTLLQPWTYMNRSGDALLAWARETGWRVGVAPDPPDPLTPEPVAATVAAAESAAAAAAPAPVVVPIVVCDDLHLALGSVRIRGRGSDGGQKGLASVTQAIGGQSFPRVRLGVGPPDAAVPPIDWADYVLADFAAEELAAAAELAQYGADALLAVLAEGWPTATVRYNRRGRPELPG